MFACGSPTDDRDDPMFSNGEAGTDADAEAGTVDETGGDMGTGDGDGDPGTTGDGDGDPGTTGDGDGDPGTTGDGDGDPGDCATDPAQVGTSCGQGSAYHGAFPIGEMSTDMPVGAIVDTDNGQGNGAEDWYQVDFPLMPDTRPMAGTAVIEFAENGNDDYRFEVYRDCGAQAYGQGLAAEFGASAPPLSEWSFSDLNPDMEQLEYMDNIPWPTTVWVRVFRFQNNPMCTTYQLQVSRTM
ncbi:Ccs1/ResB-related putative cytochrome C-type biogenesis protein [Enhygromyxa salina]|uniref:Ccs1/ResB-related putative cytochrome C-type biogenesis protein n=1 Tax=Enhygromyxa salina TaxID=215803 RepID=A0A0C1ZUZ7_9BACT|nr:hypothetical protein [Enhygromyxa salina]KIG14888.1 Ccs1/ResB-related putative cytochrome C-type biogenesis protein [Enhygromyxa salina]